ncbi:MAG: protein kinase domain-containing protein [Vicinamibacterales bacterium]
MTLASGTRVGPYEITALMGAGGMGEVYRATDTKLKREVAIKVLPTALASDPERLARFQREAEVLATLNHPNIAAIYGLEEGPSVRALVMELVEGPTLAERIERRMGPFGPAGTAAGLAGAPGPKGPGLQVDEALAIARQIADALEAAHERGIVHRDLKPANIKVRDDGAVKVLDFGLAKLIEPGSGIRDPGSEGVADDDVATYSPTLSLAATRAGVILGTAAYMSPEQARGKRVDRRADIWAFGCVLYEMLAGRRAFDGDDITVTLARVVEREPDFDALSSAVPPRVAQALRVCLQKDPRRRVRDIHDVRLALEGAFETTVAQTAAPAVAAQPAPRSERAASMAAGVALLALAATFAMPYIRTPAAAPEMRVEITTPETGDPASFAVSPDGRRLVFVGSDGGQPQLWLRSLDGLSAQPLVGTEGAMYPFWSADSRSVGFFMGTELKRIDFGGGPPRTLTRASPRGGAWNADDIILYTQAAVGPLFRMSASGGEAVVATTLEAGHTSHRFPHFLPGGRQFLFYVQGTPEARGIYLGSLDSAENKRLTAADAAGVYASPGWLLFVRQGTLLAQRLDVARGAVTGDPVTLADRMTVDANVSLAALSTSAGGLVAYRFGGGAGRRQLVWFDRSGKALGTLAAPDENGVSYPRVSPDGRQVLVYRTVEGNADIWVIDAVRMRRLTFDPGLDRFAVWSADGSRVVFDSTRTGHRDLYVKLSNGAGVEEVFVASPDNKVAYDWSADGRFFVYAVVADPKTGYDLWIVPLEGDRKPLVWLNTPFDERNSTFSSDGRWMAYTSNESGQYEVYVRLFLGAGASPVQGSASGQWQISTTGGIWPHWRRDGNELYYIAPDGKLMAVPITIEGTTVNAGAPVALFQTQIIGGGTNIDLGRQYDVAPDGRFLINVATDQTTNSPIVLILNWGRN